MSENNEKVLEDLKSFSKSLRKAILDTALEGGSSSSHFGGALSIVEIVSILFHYKMWAWRSPLKSSIENGFS